MFKVTQREQGGTYLPCQSSRFVIIKLGILVAKSNCEDMAGLAAAPDTLPLAAIFLAFAPRGKAARWVASDALLERQ